MSMHELVVWAAMAGAIALLCLVGTLDLMVQRTEAVARGLAFLVMTGGAAIWMSGLPEILYPNIAPQAVLMLKVSLGPLAGALALSSLGIWLGAGRDDEITRWTLLVCGVAIFMMAVGLALGTVFSDSTLTPLNLIKTSLATVLVGVMVAAFTCMRAVVLGDDLARWMVVACVCLCAMVLGLYAKELAIPGLGIEVWTVTVLFTVAHFLIMIVLTMQRSREVKRVNQLARGFAAQDFDIPMPQGSRLIPRVADVIWRSERLERDCVVAAIVVSNLYEVADDLGHGVEAQILAVLAARIRRHVGFRNVVGLYHPRCFILAVSPGQDPRRGDLLVVSLLRSLREGVRVGPPDHRLDFWPTVGMGLVEIKLHSTMEALAAINRAEQLALEDLTRVEYPEEWSNAETMPSLL